jgi:hypothetical protein
VLPKRLGPDGDFMTAAGEGARCTRCAGVRWWPTRRRGCAAPATCAPAARTYQSWGA